MLHRATRTCESSRINIHSGGGQVGVLVLQSPIQRQASFFLVVCQQGGDGQGVFVGTAGLHCLAVETKLQLKLVLPLQHETY